MDSQQGSPNSGNSHAAYPAANPGSTSGSSSPPPSPPPRPDSACGHMAWERAPFPFGAVLEPPRQNPMPLPSNPPNPPPSPRSTYPVFTSAGISPSYESSFTQSQCPPATIIFPANFPANWPSSSQRAHAAQPSGRHNITDGFDPSEIEELAQRLEQAFNDPESGNAIHSALPIRTRTTRVSKPGPYAPKPRARGTQPSTTPEADTSSAMPRVRSRESRRAAHRDASDGHSGRSGTSSWLLSHPLWTGEAFRRSYLHPFGRDTYRHPPRVARSEDVNRAESSASKPKSIFGDGTSPPKPEGEYKSIFVDGTPPPKPEAVYKSIFGDGTPPPKPEGEYKSIFGGPMPPPKPESKLNFTREQIEQWELDYSARYYEDDEMGEAAGDDEYEDEDEEGEEEAEQWPEDASHEGAFEDVVLVSDSEEWEQVSREEEPWDLVELPFRPAQQRPR
ncbi:hypothetical protein IQ07DRAFT_365931 [Pyrenochaeta sp. DS3sAY3a]|nr:hypothetical protein IQ07DRAFT_365931 [Pyrenochaeta sp. DS3sAY3a]